MIYKLLKKRRMRKMITIKIKLDGEIDMEFDVEDILHTDLMTVVEQYIRENMELVMEHIIVEE